MIICAVGMGWGRGQDNCCHGVGEGTTVVMNWRGDGCPFSSDRDWLLEVNSIIFPLPALSPPIRFRERLLLQHSNQVLVGLLVEDCLTSP